MLKILKYAAYFIFLAGVGVPLGLLHPRVACESNHGNERSRVCARAALW